MTKSTKRLPGIFSACLLLVVLGCSGSDGDGGDTKMILPIQASAVSNIWPFGARGGDHPEGHPGIDFEAASGTPIMAAAEGSVTWIGDSVYAGEQSIMIHSEDLGDHFYTTYFQTIVVATGQHVSQGQRIADLALWPGMKVGALHFGLKRSNVDVCPYDYMTDAAKAELDELLRKASYDDKSTYPLICNYN